MLFRSLLQVFSSHLTRLWGWYVLGVCVGLCVALLFLVSAPWHDYTNKSVSIPYGASVTATAVELEKEHVIRSPFLFKVLVVVFYKPHAVQAGLYSFPAGSPIYNVAWRLTHGVTGTKAQRITFPEGTTVRGMASILKRSLPDFDSTTFIEQGIPYEGYLFPDTYYFSLTVTPKEVLEILRETYTAHSEWKKGNALTPEQERAAVILASLIEAEAKTPEDRKIVAGILLKRISLHMLLQVDAPFGYEKGIAGYIPTHNDTLLDTPYNTYLHQGLTPTPINNPGEESLFAALHPTQSDYLYYLTGTDGSMYYAKTFKDHIANQHLYFK